MTRRTIGLTLALLLAAAGGCAHTNFLPGTRIPATEDNQAILETVEQYRILLVQKNVDGLLMLASKKYFEDGGTPQASDDYGYDGLRDVLDRRLKRVQSLRYDIQYRSVIVKGNTAEVEAFLNGAFEIQDDTGDHYRRLNDYHRFTLERIDNNRWRFLGGM